MLKQHEYNFPIQDQDQLTKSVEALGALYEVAPYDSADDGDSHEGFIKFVSGLVEPKQPKV